MTPHIHPEQGEVIWPNEEALTARIVAMVQKTIRDRHFSDGRPAQRDVHLKAHGCVRAEFRVEAKLPPKLAQGVFVPGAVYGAWIRFSNGTGNRPDRRGDARGMAIKLVGVPGEKILATEKDAGTQDFLLINNPTFFADDPARYAAFIARGAHKNALIAATAPLTLGWKGFWVAFNIVTRSIASPLETRYWSTVPYSLGLEVVKYSARPCVVGSSTIPSNPGADYLREAMVRSLDVQELCFDFLVQLRAEKMQVEDVCTEWREEEAPFVKVATITIPKQVFDTLSRRVFSENLSFTPWHSLPGHRPLGGVNRVRRAVYEAASVLRHQLNGIDVREPGELSGG